MLAAAAAPVQEADPLAQEAASPAQEAAPAREVDPPAREVDPPAQEAEPGANPLDAIDLRVTEDMVTAAQAIIESTRGGIPQRGDRGGAPNRVERMVGYSREALLNLPGDDEAKRDWVYWPRHRVGLSLEYMTADQRALVHDFLRASLSAVGYLKTVHVMQTEEILSLWEDIGLPRGNEKYWLAFFGTPSMEYPWAWRFEGHHVSLNVSVAPGGVRVTPTFFGADPAEVPTGPLAGFRPHAGVEDLGRALILSMDESQRGAAILSEEAPREIFATNLGRPRDDWETWKRTLAPEGIPVAALRPDQRQLAQRLLVEVVGAYRPEISSAYLNAINIDSLNFRLDGERPAAGAALPIGCRATTSFSNWTTCRMMPTTFIPSGAARAAISGMTCCRTTICVPIASSRPRWRLRSAGSVRGSRPFPGIGVTIRGGGF